MSRHVFPYVADERLRPDLPPERVLRPLLDYTVDLGGEFWSADALVDTGSPRTLFKHEVGEALRIGWHRPGAEYDYFEMLGGRHAAQKETVDLFLNRSPDVRWRADVWFFVEHWDWKLSVSAIFGNDGFLDQWAVTFLRSREQFVVEDQDEYESRTGRFLPRTPAPGPPSPTAPPAAPTADPRTGDEWWRPRAD